MCCIASGCEAKTSAGLSGPELCWVVLWKGVGRGLQADTTAQFLHLPDQKQHGIEVVLLPTGPKRSRMKRLAPGAACVC